MLNSKGARDPERETAALGFQPSTAAVSSSPRNSQVSGNVIVTAEQAAADICRNPANVWGEDEGGEPEGIALTFDNVASMLSAPDRSGFEVFDLIQTAGGSCIRHSLGRFIRFAGQSAPVPLDEDAGVHVTRALRCLEQRGCTLIFAYADEDTIDRERNSRDFAMWLRTADVCEVELTIGVTA